MAKIHKFEKSILIPHPADEVFSYHLCIENIAISVPGHIKVKIINAPRQLTVGDGIHLSVSLHGFIFNWKSSIIEMNKNVEFVDRMDKGPISFWRHRHTFKPEPGGTLMTEEIEYALPFGLLGSIANRIFVERELRNIFEVRHRRALENLQKSG